MIDAFITMIYDADWAKKYPRIMWSSLICSGAFLVSLMYCTEFGFWLLDAIDTHTNNVALIFIVWSEIMSATILYRYKDVVGQVGMPAFLVHNCGYILAKIIGLAIAHTASPGGGAGAGFGIYIITTVASLVMAKTPDSPAPRFWGKNALLNKAWWLGFYSVHSKPPPSSHAQANIEPGQPAPPRPQRHSRTSRKRQLDIAMDLARNPALFLRPCTRHRLLFRLPDLHRRPQRPAAHLRLLLRTPRHRYRPARLHVPAVLEPARAEEAQGGGPSGVCSPGALWTGRYSCL